MKTTIYAYYFTILLRTTKQIEGALHTFKHLYHYYSRHVTIHCHQIIQIGRTSQHIIYQKLITT